MTPTADAFVWDGHYEPGSLIWRNRWTTPEQRIKCRDALSYPAQATATMRVVLDPRANFGTDRFTGISKKSGVWSGVCGELHVRWTGAPEATRQADGSLAFTLAVTPDSTRDLMLEISDEPLGDASEAGELWHSTETAWDQAGPSTSEVTSSVPWSTVPTQYP